MVFDDIRAYLTSVLKSEDYETARECFTSTDAEGRERRGERNGLGARGRVLIDFGQEVQTRTHSAMEGERRIERGGSEAEGTGEGGSAGEGGEEEETIERYPVLEGIRQYYEEGHVLLVGAPGAGKSTALVRLLLEEAERALVEGGEALIPVLVELRYWNGSVLGVIREFLLKHKWLVEEREIEQLLLDERLLLLVDGLNELPLKGNALAAVERFRKLYSDVRMVWTSRVLGAQGGLGIERRLEILPLNEMQMGQFVRRYLGDLGEEMLRRLGDRLRQLGRTPLLLWMLCSVFESGDGEIPTNLGRVFRMFTGVYVGRFKGDVPVDEESRVVWERLLSYVAYEMVMGDEVAIEREELEGLVRAFFQEAQGLGSLYQSPKSEFAWVQELLDFHLLQTRGERVEFRHQLIQEYYAAEMLLVRLRGYSDEWVKGKVLNFVRWTEPVRLMLGMLRAEDDGWGRKIVRLGMGVDLMLGARLAGAVRGELQNETVGWFLGEENIEELEEIPEWYRVELLGETRSEVAFDYLAKLVDGADVELGKRAIESVQFFV